MNLTFINETDAVSLNVTHWYFENGTSVAYTEWTLTLQEWRYIFQRILVPIVLLVGVVGNSITIVVLTRRNMQSSTNFYLTALAVSDLLYLIFVFSLSLEHIHGMDHKSMWLYWQYFRFALWFTDASNSTSTCLTVVFTVERYIAVCHPMKRKIFCTQTRAKRIIGAVYMICFASTVTTPFEWVIVANPKTNNTTLKLDYSVLGANDTYKKTFYWFTAVIFILIPLVFLTVFNSFLILAVKRSQIQRNQLTQRNKLGPTAARTISHQSADVGETPSTPFLHNEKGGQVSKIAKKNSLGFQIEKKNSTGNQGSLQPLPPRSLRGVRDFHSSQENKITRMLIAVVILALLCQSPTAIMLIYTSFTEVPYGTTPFYVTRILGNIFNFLTTVNAACNFILYCAMSDRFRKTFLQTFCGKWLARRSFPYHESETGAMEVSNLQQHFKRSTSSVLRMGSSKSTKLLKPSITNETLAIDWPKSAENSNGGLNFQDLDANELLED